MSGPIDPEHPNFERHLRRALLKANRDLREERTGDIDVLDDDNDEDFEASDPEIESALNKAKLVIAAKQIEKLDLELDEMRLEKRDRDTSSERKRTYFFSGSIGERDYEWMTKTLAQWARDSSDPVTVVINSPGGYVIHTLAMYDFLRGLSKQGIKVVTVGIGEIASGGGILLQAGDVRVLTPNSWFLVHEVSAGSIGKSSEMEEQLKFVKRLQDKCLAILAKRSTLTQKEIATKWKKKDWWMTAEEAVTLGFADIVEEGWTY